MSLSIPTANIIQVMIGNEWFPCTAGSFYIDAYEFHDESGDHHDSFPTSSGVTYVGFSFRTDGEFRLCGPMTAIKAVKVDSGFDDRPIGYDEWVKENAA